MSRKNTAEDLVENTAESTAESTEGAKKYFDDQGREISRSAYIRKLFVDGMSRGEIAKQLGVPYYIVYSATANMYNERHPQGGQGVTHRGVIMEDGRSRAEHMREMFTAGISRGEIAKHFNVPYATVYAATKELGASEEKAHGGRVMVTLPDGTQMARVDYIRKLFAEGKTRREIANELSCDYAVVWAATKEKKEESESDSSEANISDSEVSQEELLDAEQPDDPDM